MLKKFINVTMCMLTVMVGIFISSTVVAAEESLTVYFNDIGGLWPANNTATYEKGAIVDGRSCVCRRQFQGAAVTFRKVRPVL